jgi:hypothetical protein
MKQLRMESTPSNGKTVQELDPSFRALKDREDEDTDYEQQMAHYEKNYPYVYYLEYLWQNVFVMSVPFAKEHKAMLVQCQEMLEYQNGYVVEIGDCSLNKNAKSFDDCFHTFRLSFQFWH